MSNLSRVAFSLVMFALSGALLWFGPRLLGQSRILTCGVLGGFAVSVWAMFPVQAAQVKSEGLDLLNKWRGK